MGKRIECVPVQIAEQDKKQIENNNGQKDEGKQSEIITLPQKDKGRTQELGIIKEITLPMLALFN